MRRFMVILVAGVLAFAISSHATIINVPDDYPTIQEGIDASVNGDTVLVQPGIYDENVTISVSNIVLKSASGREETTIDGGSRAQVIVVIADSVIVDGFEIRNGITESQVGGGGINTENGIHTKILNNWIIDNSGDFSGGVAAGDSCLVLGNIIENNSGFAGGLTVRNHYGVIVDSNIFRGNQANWTGGGGIWAYNTSLTISNNIIEYNSDGYTPYSGGGVSFSSSTDAILIGNLIRSNTGDGLYSDNGACIVEASNNTIINNSGYGIRVTRGAQVASNNCIIRGNSESLYADEEMNTELIVLCSDVEGGADDSSNFDLPPLFCDPQTGDYHLAANSPCAPENNDCGELIGAFPVGCGSIYQTWHVSIDGDDINGDGSEENPFATIQHGIDMAIDGDTVLVWPGIYYENIDFNGKAIMVTSNFIFDGDSLTIEQTIIDGDSIATVVNFSSGEDSSSILINLTITNGFGTGGYGDGGGITCRNASPSILGCNIHLNVVVDGYGGGIHVLGSNPIIKYNKIHNNVAVDVNVSFSSGGGIWGRDGNPDIIGNMIYNNFASSRAGGVGGGDSLYIARNKIYGNTCDGAGGGVQTNFSKSFIGSNLIYDNEANEGGGVCFQAYGPSSAIPVSYNNTIYGNTANSGGGIYCHYQIAGIVVNSIIYSNTGGNIYDAGGTNLSVTYSDVEGGYAGVGNIDTDPLFRNPVDYDFHLMSTTCGDNADSPCIDAGDPLICDLIRDCDHGLAGIRSDMGAYGGGIQCSEIPTLSEWGMLIMGLLLLAVGTVALIRRRQAVTEQTP